MSKRVVILFCVGVVILAASLFLLKYDLSKEYEADENKEDLPCTIPEENKDLKEKVDGAQKAE
jgi:hypothetical protein